MAEFSLNIQKHVKAGLVVSGKFDGSHACLAAATPGGTILVHSPHRQPQNVNFTDDKQPNKRLSWSGELAELQIGTEVKSLCTGRLGEDEREILLVGTITHVLAYHVEDNADVFYKEMSDGANCMIVAKVGWLPHQVVVVGGNCSVTVLDARGTEIFWMVMGGIVTSLAVYDFDGDGENELLTGTTDYEIRVQKEDVMLWETKETAAIVALTDLPNRQFAYAVDNGTIGVYEAGQRLWRVKSKHKVASIGTFDVNGDGVPELITGWSTGKVDARTYNTGEVIFKIQLSSGVAGIVEADYRRTGKPDLVVASVNGEVRGYSAGSATQAPEPGEIVRELLAKKQALQMELRQRSAAGSSLYHGSRLAISLLTKRGAARVALAAGPGLLVHCAIVFAEGVFEGETLVTHPTHPQGELEIALYPAKNDPVDIHVKVYVGPYGADLMQVFEVTRQLPRFCMYELVPRPQQIPEGLLSNGVVADVAERPQRIAIWLNQSLILGEELEVAESGPKAGCIEVWLRGMRDDKVHCFKSNASGKVTIQTDDPTLAGDVIQSLAMYLGVRELNSEATFPAEESRMLDALERVKGLREVDARLQAEAAGGAALLKSIVIRLEDARILENVDDMRRRLTQLKNINGDLIREHEIRLNSHRELAASLKELNVGVQRAARLRVGKAASNTVARCRAAIQDENPKALALAIRHG
ncbi:PREDICTED: Bardet-Biedl syndrome 2 protein homolog isoform X2 [Dinoponera quadriceps]|uniref:Bardet-Biedl syndrome 2 protein homolog n=1 Tax=Dinoponera quadriceps TaxID=609295 RepID=A0A6P3WT53_DINQU|nr:PREDICTED: Bardet-Biedl syndrome 2 protein homolog isoform X2 [Dinoponera quadriceps]